MKTIFIRFQINLLLFVFVLIISCEGQDKNSLSLEEAYMEADSSYHHLIGPLSAQECENDPALLINSIVNTMYQDKSGLIWFGTDGKGVIRYDGNFIEYFSTGQGFGGKSVREITEDDAANVWFATSGGLSKYDGSSFTNFTEEDGLLSSDLSSIAIDEKGVIWIGTSKGINLFDGQNFTNLAIPNNLAIRSIQEDREGNMWFGTNEGAYIYDGSSFSTITEKDGLCDKVVNDILEDNEGVFWFATENNGVCKWDGTSFTHIQTEKGHNGSSKSWSLFQDKAGKVWFPIDGVCLYQYDGNTAVNYFEKQGCISHTIRYTLEDNQGRLWFGGWLGVYRYGA